MSLDSGTNIYPYFRTGNWDTLKDNIQKFRAVNRHTVLSIVCTTSAYQLMDIENVFKSFLELDVDTINAAMVYTPKYLNPAVMSIEFKEEILADIKKVKDMIFEEEKKRHDNFEHYSKTLRSWKPRWNRFNDTYMALRSINEIEHYVKNHQTTSNFYEDFLVYVRKTDEIWGHSFNDYMKKFKFVNGRIERNKDV
jgi:hypothetical protein